MRINEVTYEKLKTPLELNGNLKGNCYFREVVTLEGSLLKDGRYFLGGLLLKDGHYSQRGLLLSWGSLRSGGCYFQRVVTFGGRYFRGRSHHLLSGVIIYFREIVVFEHQNLYINVKK